MWSHDRLGDRERVLFRGLAVFRYSFDLRTAAAVCAGGGLGPQDVAVGIAELVSQSLVMARDGSCRQLDTIREYGSRCLTEAGEADMVLRKLAGHCLTAQRIAAGSREARARRTWTPTCRPRLPGAQSPTPNSACRSRSWPRSDGRGAAIRRRPATGWNGWAKPAPRPSALAIRTELEIA